MTDVVEVSPAPNPATIEIIPPPAGSAIEVAPLVVPTVVIEVAKTPATVVEVAAAERTPVVIEVTHESGPVIEVISGSTAGGTGNGAAQWSLKRLSAEITPFSYSQFTHGETWLIRRWDAANLAVETASDTTDSEAAWTGRASLEYA